MTGRAVPSPEQVLRALFWKLLCRGRTAFPQQQTRRRRPPGLGLTLTMYTLFGILPGALAFFAAPLTFASSLHAFTLLFASLTLASAAGTMLFVREEAEILLHRPVRPEQLLRAKAAVLIGYSLLLALALNAAGLLLGFWNRGNAWWFSAAHAVTTLLLMLLSAASIVLVYNVCLRWFGRERFENLLTVVQTLLTVVMVAGSQLVTRSIDAVGGLDPVGSWVMALPPLWFGALDAVLCGVDVARLWPFALLAVLLTAVVTWLAFVRLGHAYGEGLLSLNESDTRNGERPARRGARRLRRLAHAAPLKWWLRDPIERQAFLLASAYLLRDRETKLKLYPSLAPMLVMPVVFAVGPVGRDEGPRSFLLTIGLAYVAIVPMQALMLLRHSEQWRAAAMFRTAALPHWAPLFHGARKAVLLWLTLPCLLLAATILAAIGGSPLPFLLALPTCAVLPVCAPLPGLAKEWLPLSQPSEDVRGQAGCLLFGGAVVVSMVVGTVGGAMFELDWFWPFVLVLGGLSVVAQTRLLARIRARHWQAAAS